MVVLLDQAPAYYLEKVVTINQRSQILVLDKN